MSSSSSSSSSTLAMAWNFMFGLWVSMILAQLCAGCLREEKEALLEFKASINETQNRHFLLPSWDDPENDCCSWEGVKCSNSTGRIIELSLRRLWKNIVENSDAELRDWFLNATTFLPLKELRFLDLSYNFFQSEVKGCRQLSRLENLEILYLGGNNFNNNILSCLSAISTLKKLSLCDNWLDGLFPIQEITRLRNLEALDISYNYFEGSLSFKDTR